MYKRIVCKLAARRRRKHQNNTNMVDFDSVGTFTSTNDLNCTIFKRYKNRFTTIFIIVLL